jgi:hypothetical protein
MSLKKFLTVSLFLQLVTLDANGKSWSRITKTFEMKAAPFYLFTGFQQKMLIINGHTTL